MISSPHHYKHRTCILYLTIYYKAKHGPNDNRFMGWFPPQRLSLTKKSIFNVDSLLSFPFIPGLDLICVWENPPMSLLDFRFYSPAQTEIYFGVVSPLLAVTGAGTLSTSLPHHGKECLLLEGRPFWTYQVNYSTPTITISCYYRLVYS